MRAPSSRRLLLIRRLLQGWRFLPPSSRLFKRLLVGATLVATAATAVSEPSIECYDMCVAGREARVVVKTADKKRSNYVVPGSGYEVDAKWWLVRVDLSAGGRSRSSAPVTVFGPIWEGGGQPLLLDGNARIHYQKMDRRTRESTPPAFAFDAEGMLVRIRLDPETADGYERHTLAMSVGNANWQPAGDYRPAPVVTPADPPLAIGLRFLEPNPRFRFEQTSEGRVTLHDSLTGERIAKDWIDAAIATIQAIDSGGEAWLTEDQKFFVVSPPNWMKGGNEIRTTGQRRLNFLLGAKEYRSLDHGFYFSEGHPGAQVFERTPSRDPAWWRPEDPNGAFTITGRLFLLNSKNGKLRLRAVEGGTVFESVVPWASEVIFGQRWQHNEAEGRLRLAHRKTDDPLVVEVLEWNYRADTSSRYELPLLDWFEISRSSYAPRVSPNPVR